MFFKEVDIRDEGRNRETSMLERNINQLPPVCAPTGDQPCNVGMFPDPGLNPQPFGTQDDAPTN